jgi:hypothetical protein
MALSGAQTQQCISECSRISQNLTILLSSKRPFQNNRKKTECPVAVKRSMPRPKKIRAVFEVPGADSLGGIKKEKCAVADVYDADADAGGGAAKSMMRIKTLKVKSSPSPPH